jgi:hypothetical protein
MGDTVAHLPGADHSDSLDGSHIPIRSMLVPAPGAGDGRDARFPVHSYDEPPGRTTGGLLNYRITA